MPILNASAFNSAGLVGSAAGSARGDARAEIIVVDGTPVGGLGAVVKGSGKRDRLARAERNGGQGAAGRVALDAPGRKWAASPDVRGQHRLRCLRGPRKRLRSVFRTLIQDKQRKHA